PPFATGICKPPEKVRCTTYRGISFLLLVVPFGMPRSYEQARPGTSGGPPRLGAAGTHLGRRVRAPCNRLSSGRSRTPLREVQLPRRHQRMTRGERRALLGRQLVDDDARTGVGGPGLLEQL